MPRALSITLLSLIILTSILIALHAFGFQFRVSGDPVFHARFDTMPIAGAMHVIGGGIVLALGGFQFSSRLRQNYLTLHRNMGRAYLILVAVGGVGALVLAPSADGGLVGRFGFFLLGVAWLFSGWQAYAAVRRGDIQSHKAWMLRNFSMTFGAVTLRIYLGLFAVAGVPFEASYPVVAWLAWVPNLIIVEWYMALTEQSRKTAKLV